MWSRSLRPPAFLNGPVLQSERKREIGSPPRHACLPVCMFGGHHRALGAVRARVQVRGRPLNGQATPALVSAYIYSDNSSAPVYRARYIDVADLSPGAGYQVRATDASPGAHGARMHACTGPGAYVHAWCWLMRSSAHLRGARASRSVDKARLVSAHMHAFRACSSALANGGCIL